MDLDANGLVLEAKLVQSPNFDERPTGEQITLLVIHSISLPPGEFGGDFVECLFTNTLDCSLHPYFFGLQGLRLSAHFFIDRKGSITQFVRVIDRAWHAGESVWRGRQRCNDFSVGVELEGIDDQQFAAPQYGVLADLTTALQHRYPIRDIVGHADIAPGRKTDPGPGFDWERFRMLIGP